MITTRGMIQKRNNEEISQEELTKYLHNRSEDRIVDDLVNEIFYDNLITTKKIIEYYTNGGLEKTLYYVNKALEKIDEEQKDEYEIIKKYLLANETTYELMQEMFPDTSIPYMKIEENGHLIYTDGFLFVTYFEDEVKSCNCDHERFYTIYSTHNDEYLTELERNEIFIRMRECDMYYALDFIEYQAFEEFREANRIELLNKI